MKYVVVIGDGMADEPLKELGGKTPIEAAGVFYMNTLATYGEVGTVRTVPEGMTPASDVANLSVMGYNPSIYYSGRSPLEAVSMGVELKDDDVCFRCNVVTLSEEDCAYEDRTIIDHSCDEISTEEAAVLIELVEKEFGDTLRRFYAGRSYRHALVWNKGSEKVNLTPPHDILGKRIGDYLPEGDNSAEIWDMMKKSYELLENHPINISRRQRGLKPANSIWIWGEGHKPSLASFESLYGLKGCVISAVDLILGLGICVGLKPIEVEGATGNIDTNYKGKADAALKALLEDGLDFAYIHVEAPDECGHRHEIQNKVKAISRIDTEIVGHIKEKLEDAGVEWAMMVLPDHPTPIRLRTHSPEPVPYVIYRSDRQMFAPCRVYSEREANDVGMEISDGYTLMRHFIKNED